MKIFNAEQIRAWDKYTISHEPVSSVDLMERAAVQCTAFINSLDLGGRSFIIFCGKGNNGGDGLAIARLLAAQSIHVTVYIIGDDKGRSADNTTNLERLQPGHNLELFQLVEPLQLPPIAAQHVVIDCLFGSGLHSATTGLYAQLIKTINESNATVIAIDVPSGLMIDQPTEGTAIIQAHYTLTFQCTKLAFMAPENEAFTGKVVVLDIGLHPDFNPGEPTVYELVEASLVKRIYRPRNGFSHKGTYGHALLVAGSYGKMGAAVLAARACLRTGAGLLTCHIPSSGYNVLQASIPEAMVVTDYNSSYNTAITQDLSTYKSIGIGPGIGTASETASLLREIMTGFTKPMVIDADALNILAKNPSLMNMIPPGSVLTPHPREFERLFGKTSSSFEQFSLAISKASELDVVIILKGHHTLVATPGGNGFFNNTGNAGMAKGGTGDTLTGMITALLSQGYQSADAAILGVYLHGLAGDIAASRSSMEAMLASDLIECIGHAFSTITGQPG